jgi:hypothetical protein
MEAVIEEMRYEARSTDPLFIKDTSTLGISVSQLLHAKCGDDRV